MKFKGPFIQIDTYYHPTPLNENWPPTQQNILKREKNNRYRWMYMRTATTKVWVPHACSDLTVSEQEWNSLRNNKNYHYKTKTLTKAEVFVKVL